MPEFIYFAGLLVFCAGAAWFWWHFPRRYVDGLRRSVRDPKERADVEDNLRKSVGQLIGGGAVIVGACLAYYQTQTTLSASNEQSLRSLAAAHDLLVSSQVSKGFEQLGSDRILIRLGGIYALEGAMDPSARYYQQILESLCAFVREATRMPAPESAPATDVQAALTVIGRRQKGPGQVDLTGARIWRSEFEGSDLSDSILVAANLSSSYLSRNAKSTNLARANLFRADLTTATLAGANLTDAVLIGANLTGADLSGANLTGSKMMRASLSEPSMPDAQELRTNLSNANLSNSRLAKSDMTGANLIGANLKNADVSATDLSLADLTNAHITQVQLDEACGIGVILPSPMTIRPCR